MRKRFDGAAKALGVTGSQWRVLLLLNRSPGLNQGQIAEQLEVEPITTCRMIDRMEQAGLVERRRDPLDRRARLIFLTDAAAPLLGGLRDMGETVASHSLRGFSDADREQLMILLDRVRNNLASDDLGDSPRQQVETVHG
ncbi:MAG: MarR family transcriptional regulator [Sphingobium sp.]|uniref:MarR family winged helix-turn-helix transcriptional regulator n=1 Tax=Sphingobium sp. TaxID=1912891 RepID=UPI0029B2309E|nr:MarR family transcriptional regulator [Sphingobium sp.]MDX3908952.1 MarR family transcriptional regulator [Sphingobium sp.]